MLSLLLGLALVSTEGGQTFETVVHGQPDEDAHAEQRRLDRHNPGFSTAVDLDQSRDATSADDTATLLARVPAASVRSIGGLGQYSSLSLRGSAGTQVAFFLDGVPIDSDIGGLMSLGDVPLDTLGRIEIYRGHVPVDLGSTLGGAVNFVGKIHRGPAFANVTVGIGSFGGRELRLTYAMPMAERTGLALRVGYTGADGDFSFLDRGGIDANPVNDAVSQRMDNGYDRLLSQIRVDGRGGDWRWGAQQLTLTKRQGIPGPFGTQPTGARLSTAGARWIAHARRALFGPGGWFAAVAGLGVEHLHFSDPFALVGPGRDDETNLGIDAYLSPRMRLPLWAGGFLRASAHARIEHRRIDSAIPRQYTSGDAQRLRIGFGAGAEIDQRLFTDRLQLVAALRIDANDSRFATAAGTGEVNDVGSDALTYGLSPRAAARWRIIEGLDVRASAGRYFRAPTVVELFGDRGYIEGNEGLVPESGTAIDSGVVLDATWGPLGLYAHAAGFATWSENTIVWIPTGSRSQPRNLTDAPNLAAGFETSVAASAFSQRVGLTANYTFLHSENGSPELSQNGRPLPGRPEHQFFARAHLGERFAALWGELEARLAYTVELIDGNNLDLAARVPVPRRVLHGLGAELTYRGSLVARLRFDIRNLTDRKAGHVPALRPYLTDTIRPLSDFIGHPLPGRSLWLSLSLSTPSPSQEKTP